MQYKYIEHVQGSRSGIRVYQTNMCETCPVDVCFDALQISLAGLAYPISSLIFKMSIYHQLLLSVIDELSNSQLAFFLPAIPGHFGWIVWALPRAEASAERIQTVKARHLNSGWAGGVIFEYSVGCHPDLASKCFQRIGFSMSLNLLEDSGSMDSWCPPRSTCLNALSGGFCCSGALGTLPALMRSFRRGATKRRVTVDVATWHWEQTVFIMQSEWNYIIAMINKIHIIYIQCSIFRYINVQATSISNVKHFEMVISCNTSILATSYELARVNVNQSYEGFWTTWLGTK